MKMVNAKINNMPVCVPEGTTILEAARSIGIEIPTLCYMKDMLPMGACRICVVEVEKAKTLVASCVFPIGEGMVINTNTKRVFDARKTNLQLILSTHDRRCLSCVRSDDCEFQKLCHDFGVEDEGVFDGVKPHYDLDFSAPHMVRDNNKCILCRRCVGACEQWQAVGVIGPNDRGFNSNIGCSFNQDLGEVACVSCGQCTVVCPTGALTEKDDTEKVWAALADPTKHVIVQTAPSIRVTLGECFGMEIGTEVTGKMVAALRRLGFDGVFDTDVAADLTILEEANEFVERVTNNGVLPLITSCSPGWINFCEHYYPEFIPNLSSCKSPQQMFGAIAKTWYAKKQGIDPKDIFVVSIMPCTAKKFEVTRDGDKEIPDVDVSLTTRELGRMIDKAGLNFKELPDEDFDAPLGVSTGAAVIFGATGGVMEAALRTACEWITGETLDDVEFTDVRGPEGFKRKTYKVGDLEVKVAVCSGLANAKKVLDAVKSGEEEFHFIEIMACPGGCINGGGQPLHPAHVRNFVDLKGLRTNALYEADRDKEVRKSHENPVLQEIYKTYLEKYGSHEAHRILHTSYVPRDRF